MIKIDAHKIAKMLKLLSPKLKKKDLNVHHCYQLLK